MVRLAKKVLKTQSYENVSAIQALKSGSLTCWNAGLESITNNQQLEYFLF